ncbi:MAG: outer membrane beta-barrel protein [Wolbachia endosymbiont of Tyrophagus putrescentiae]|nr:outer membrane beta-barrel protein [Wolbachia endosymbiont of Tyrophagus putrescentiae]
MKRLIVLFFIALLSITGYTDEYTSSPPDLKISNISYIIRNQNIERNNQQKESPEKYGFYTGISGGKVFFDNSEIFIDGIKTIGEKIKNLVEEDSYFSAFVKKFIVEQIDDINQFKGKVNFKWLGSTHLGYHVRENGRFDCEIMYSQINIENNGTPVFDKSASILGFLLNLYYNPRIKDTKFAPYVGLGIGPTVFRLKRVSKPPLGPMPLNVPWFAYQAKLGVDYSIIPGTDIFFGYRYFSMPIPIVDDIAAHNLEVGLRFNF